MENIKTMTQLDVESKFEQELKIKEIEQVSLEVEVFEEVQSDAQKIQNSEKLFENVSSALQCLDQGESGLVPFLHCPKCQGAFMRQTRLGEYVEAMTGSPGL